MPTRKPFAVLIGITTVLALSIAISCSSTSGTDDELVLSGTVQDNSNKEPIEGALVEILSPEELSRYHNTNADGTFSFGIEIEEPTDIELQASKSGYVSGSQNLRIAPGSDITDLTFALSTPEDTTGGGSDDDNEQTEPSEGSAFISLTNVSHSEIRVNGTGGVETSRLTFTVTDSSGIPINNNEAEYVTFEILQGPSGATIHPDSALTQNGEAVATIKSGTEAGVVQVMASFTRNTEVQKTTSHQQQVSSTSSPASQPSFSSDNIYEQDNRRTEVNSQNEGFHSVQEIVTHQSKPISVTISGGLPVADHFEMHTSINNIAAADNSASATISVDLADKYGNNVPEGTAVHYSTDRGSIDGSGPTDPQGVSTTQLQPGQPGMATITAETVDETSQTISKQVQVLFSGTPEISVSPQSLSLNGFTEQTFTYTLEDENGNPLAAGTSVSVSVNNDDLSLSGDTDVTLGDTQTAGEGTTEFSVTLTNPNGVDIYENGVLTITTNGPNGSATEEIALNAPDSPTITPGSITLASVSNSEIGVVSTGQTEQSQLTFQVTDSTGQPLNSENTVNVSFSLGSNSPAGADVQPKTVTTDASGEATTTLTSGTGAGVAQVIAEVTASDGSAITSQPVAVTIHAGLPDEEHFTISRSQKNITYSEDDQPAQKMQFTAYVGDVHNNTVPEGTNIYFKTDGGFIDGSAQTNADGEATVTLTAKKQFPTATNGVATITAETADDAGQTISDDVQVVFSEADPQLSTSVNSINLENLQSRTETYTVLDPNGNPLPEGTTVSVSVDNPDLQLSGDTQVTIPDAFDTGTGVSKFSFTVSNPNDIEIYEDATITIVATASDVDGSSNSSVTEIALNAPAPPALNPGNITVANVTNNEIGVVGTGQTEQTQLTFQVTDSLGRALDLENQAEVRFSLGASPGGNEGVEPTSVMTDADGQATTTLTSGTEAGIVQVVAKVTASDGTVINSQPVSVAIHAGLPDQDHFSLASSTNNVAASTGTEVFFTAYVGDKYGNVVAEGTTIYFTTDGGYITGSAQTDQNGMASATLRAVSPTPGDGTATITASTANDQQTTITASKDIIFSGGPSITVSPNSINMPNDANTTFNYTVEDGNGYPMAPGTNIAVTVEGNEIETIGDVDITLGEPNSSFNNTSQFTDFQFNIADAAGDTVATDPVQITITSEGPNGTARTTISGTKNKGSR